MENFFLYIFESIDQSFSTRLNKLEKQIAKNNREFKKITKIKDKCKDDIYSLFCSQNKSKSLLNQVGFLCRMAKTDVQMTDLNNFNLDEIFTKYQVIT
jgi:hypothetical protein